MDWLLDLDRQALQLINSLAGHFPPFDQLIMGLANDYFMPVAFCSALFALWFIGGQPPEREKRQESALRALLGLGLANGAVALATLDFFRSRPGTELPINVLLYTPTDSSLPSNSATVLFAIAMSIWLGNRRVGSFFLLAAALQAFSRVYAGMHYPLDVISGAALGIIIALLVRWLFILLQPQVKWLLSLARQLYLA